MNKLRKVYRLVNAKADSFLSVYNDYVKKFQ